ncbi:MAG: GTPase HflX [Phycisphaerae bacterium]|nr:GTPase HflX [Phycisphaerae bacterium]
MAQPKERTAIKVQSERAIVAAVRTPDSNYNRLDPFGELRALAQQAGAVIVGEMEQQRDRPDAGTFMGSGKVEELKTFCAAREASLVIFDHDLSPRQIANIEEIVGRKVIDRSELILDIFASRATTREAQAQVELAQLEYTYPRLRAMWSHLERIVGVGGIGGIGTRGPGEQQLEIDRRLAQKRRLELQRELEEIQGRKRRMVAQRKLDHFTVGLVGYTNAGKSTLFNTLTSGGAYADDRLFSTLMTRTREWNVGLDAPAAPGAPARAGVGVRVMLSDTVGFVRDLPHNLIASFRATLEEATHADLLLIVLDVSDPAAELQHQAVTSTLDDLFADLARAEDRARKRGDGSSGAAPWREPRRVLLLNKVDRLRDNADLLVWQRRVPDAIAISARQPDGPGHAELRRVVRDAARGGVVEAVLRVPMADSRVINMIESRAEVLAREYEGDHAALRVRIGRTQIEQIRSAARTFGKGRVEVTEVPPEPISRPRRRAAAPRKR